MRTSIAISFVLASASAVLAQNSTSSTFTPPDGASQGCKSFLTTLNSNSVISSCLNALVTATNEYDPSGSNGANATSINDVLTNVCSSHLDSLCDPSVIRTSLADFSANCGTDMAPTDGSQGNTEIIDMYDTLFLVVPLRGAICSKDPSSGKYCVNVMNNGTSSQKRDLDLYERADNSTNQQTLTPDLNSYRTSGLPYLFLTPDSSMTALCSDCSARIVGSYVAFETVSPYAIGIANSPSLSGQPDLWAKIQQCSNGLANQILANSTGNTGTYNGGATGTHAGMTSVVVALMSAVVATVALF